MGSSLISIRLIQFIYGMWFTFCFLFSSKAHSQSGNNNNPPLVFNLLKPDTNEVIRLNELSVQKRNTGNYEEAEKISKQALEMSEKYNYPRGKANALNGIGNIHYMRGNYDIALDYFFQAMEIREKTGDRKGVAMSYNNIALIYDYNEDHTKAIEYYSKAMEINLEIGNLKQLGSNYNNLSMAYKVMGDLNNAMKFQNESVRIKTQLNDSAGLALSYNNLGNIYDRKKEYDQSLNYYNKSLIIRKKLNDRMGIAMSYTNLGNVYIRMGRIDEAEPILKKSLEISLQISEKPILMNTYLALSQCDSIRGNYKSALYNFKNAIVIKDSIYTESGRDKMENMKARYESEKKEIALAAITKEKKQQEESSAREKEKQNQIIYLVSGGLGLVIIFAIFIFRSLKMTQRQKKIIELQKTETELQKKLVDEKQKEIIDSINYAQRIQRAILADEEDIKKYFPDSFLLYKPKDIVAGDFYFFETAADFVFYAAADCTGHGVPGALVSVVCANALSRCVKEFQLTDPGLILNKTRELVLETFRKSGKNVKDGMDISFISRNIKTGKISWAGANNPLCILQNGRILQISPDKQPIGDSPDPKPFTTHSIDNISVTKIYLFTDGFADQFGGPKGKKFKYSQLYDLLEIMKDVPMESQKNQLNQSFIEWKKELEQIDDVCIIGIGI